MPRHSNARSGDSGHPQEDPAHESGADSARLRGKRRVETKKGFHLAGKRFYRMKIRRKTF